MRRGIRQLTLDSADDGRFFGFEYNWLEVGEISEQDPKQWHFS